MKKVVWAGVLCFLGLGTANAQTNLGVKGGVNVATLKIDERGLAPRTGLHVGLFASTPLSASFALQPEVLYSQQGVHTKDFLYTYNYLNFPLIFKGYLTGGFHVQAGPQFGILLEATQREGNLSRNITDKHNRYDGALALGLGFDVANWQVSARGTFGLSDTGQKEKNPVNKVLQLSLGYKFR